MRISNIAICFKSYFCGYLRVTSDLSLSNIYSHKLLRDYLIQAEHFDIDTIAQKYHETHKESYEKTVNLNELFPCVIPSAINMWFEFNGSSVGQSLSRCLGCLVTTIYDSVLGLDDLTVDVPEEVVKVLSSFVFIQDNNDCPRVYEVSYLIYLNNNSEIISLLAQSIFNDSSFQDIRKVSSEVLIALTAIQQGIEA